MNGVTASIRDGPSATRLALLADKQPGELVIHEIYKSLQGESTQVGRPCVLVRLAVCDARCVWCDTPHAFHRGAGMSLEAVIERVAFLECPLVLVTGGEPLLQPEVLPLMQRLCDRGLDVMLETSGAHDIAPVDARVRIVMDIKCPDSGEADHNRWNNLAVLKPIDEIKLVVASRADFDWGVQKVREHGLDRGHTVLFSPVWGWVEPRDLAAWLLGERIDARMQIQLHKVIWGGDATGV